MAFSAAWLDLFLNVARSIDLLYRNSETGLIAPSQLKRASINRRSIAQVQKERFFFLRVGTINVAEEWPLRTARELKVLGHRACNDFLEYLRKKTIVIIRTPIDENIGAFFVQKCG